MISSLTYAAVNLSIYIENLLLSLSNFGATCTPKESFLGMPTWYKYLDGEGSGMDCIPKLSQLNDVWLIVLAIVEILLRIAALAAVIYVLYGGIKFVTSRGNPDKTASARLAVQDALIGVVIAVAAIAMINFVRRSL